MSNYAHKFTVLLLDDNRYWCCFKKGRLTTSYTIRGAKLFDLPCFEVEIELAEALLRSRHRKFRRISIDLNYAVSNQDNDRHDTL